MTTPVEAVVFDVDDTLCEYCRSSAEILELAFADVGVEPFFSAEDYYAIFDDFVAESEDVVENRERCFAVLAAEAGRDPALGQAVAGAYEAERDQTNVEWLPGAREVLATLGEEYVLAAVTNGSSGMQRQKLSGLGVDDRFEAIVYAGYDTAPKPDPEPFEVALDAIDVPPERAVAVGNSRSNDVAGAHEAGLRSVWLDRDGVGDPEPEPDYRIERMDELLAEPWS